MGNEVKWGSQKWGENGEGDKMGKPKMGKKWGMGQNGEAKIVYPTEHNRAQQQSAAE